MLVINRAKRIIVIKYENDEKASNRIKRTTELRLLRDHQVE